MGRLPAGRLDSTGGLDGEPVRRSGGASVFVAPETVVGSTRDAVLAVGAAFALVAGRWSLVQEMRGYRAAASVLLASVGVDF